MRTLFFTLTLAIGLLLQTSCKEPEPVHIGFLGELTTRAAGLSTSGRDGFLLAIEEANASGGVNNRQIIGLIQDTRMHKETALHAVRTLAEKNVSAIIGPMTSQTAVSVMPEINNAKIPLISPTSSTNQLSGLDDYFFRVYYTNAQAARMLADRIVNKDQLKHVAAIFDLGNKAYTEDWVRHFQEIVEEGGGKVTRIPFEIQSDMLFMELAQQAAKAEPQAILILANAVDTAMICQHLAKAGVELPRFATGWSYSDDLIQFGGRSVEGLAVIQSANMQDPSPSVQNFVKAYRERFQAMPNFPALHAYDATRLALAAMRKSTDPEVVRKKLLSTKGFAGVQDPLSFDSYGDLKSPRLHLAKIKDRTFVATD